MLTLNLYKQKNPSIRPEFSEILEIFETNFAADKNGMNSKLRSVLRRDLSLDSSLDSIPSDGTPDICMKFIASTDLLILTLLPFQQSISTYFGEEIQRLNESTSMAAKDSY